MSFDPRNYNFNQLLVNAKSIKIRPPKFAWYTIIVTWFWVGFFPIAPGTVGSLAVYPLYNLIIEHAQDLFHLGAIRDALFKFWLCTIFLFIIGWLAIIKFQESTGTVDHKMVVIDEVVGMLVAISISFDWAYKLALKFNKFDMSERNFAFLLIFALFRFYDIYKPLFISTVDRNYKKPLGVILDDVLAGLFTAFTIFVAFKIFV